MKKGWEVRPLADICTIKPTKDEARKKLKPSSRVSFVPMNDLGELQKHFQSDTIRSLDEVQGSYTYFADGDVIVAKITPCFENGKMGIARNLENGVGFGSSEFVALRSNGKIDPEFLFYFLLRDEFRAAGARVMSGAVGHKRVPKDYFENLPIPLPPLPEQKRIVEVLDKAFEGLAIAKANAEANLQNARELFRSRLKCVFQSDGEGETWTSASLGDVCEIYQPKTISTKEMTDDGRYPVFGANGVIGRYDQYNHQEVQLLVTCRGATCGSVNLSEPFSWITGNAMVVRPRDGRLTLGFLEYFFRGAIDFTKVITGAAQPQITRASLAPVTIPIPPLRRQIAITEALKALALKCGEMEKLYHKKVAELDGLKQSLLQEAFAGELT